MLRLNVALTNPPAGEADAFEVEALGQEVDVFRWVIVVPLSSSDQFLLEEPF